WRAGALEPTLGPRAWRWPVAELGIAGILSAVVFALIADKEQPLPAHQTRSRDEHKLFPTATLWSFFFLAALAFSVRDFAGTSMASLGSLFLQKAHGYDPKWTGIMLSAIFLPSAVSNPVFGRLSDHRRRAWISS